MTLLDRFRLLIGLRALTSAIEKETRMNSWDWQLTLKKALLSLIAHGLTALVAFLAIVPDSTVNAWLTSVGVPPSIGAAATPVAMMLIRAFSNWWKHRASTT